MMTAPCMWPRWKLTARFFICTKKVLTRINLALRQVNATTNGDRNICTPDPDALFKRAADAGAKVLSPIQDYDYGYRQGIVADPFGHQWLIQKKI